MIHTIQFFLDRFVANSAEWAALWLVLSLHGPQYRPRRLIQWALFVLLEAASIAVCAITTKLGYPKYGWILYFMMLALWYAVLPVYLYYSNLFNRARLRLNKSGAVFWTTYTISFCAATFLNLTLATLVGSHPISLTITLFSIFIIFVAVVFALSNIPGWMRSFQSTDFAPPPPRVPVADYMNMTAGELVNSFDIPNERSQVAVVTLRSATSEQVDELLAIENRIYGKLYTLAVVLKLALTALAIYLLIFAFSLATSIPGMFSLCFLLDLLCWFVAVITWQTRAFGSSPGHADSIIALSFVDDVRTVPALVRGLELWSTGLSSSRTEYIGKGLLERLSQRRISEIELDPPTAWRVVRFLRTVYSMGPKMAGIAHEVALALIQTPAIANNPSIHSYIEKLAQKKSTVPEREDIQAAARDVIG